MHLSPQLTFDGTCEAAFRFYAAALGGTIATMLRYGETPLAAEVPAAWANRIAHATLELGGSTLMGTDARPDDYVPLQGVSIVIGIADPARARAAFDALAVDGSILVPFEPTFWALAFGVVTDHFGVTWDINCEQPPPIEPAPG